MLLFPDMLRTQHEAEEFVYAAPCTRAEWHALMELARGRLQPEDSKLDYLRTVILKEGNEEIAIILRNVQTSDEDCLETAAWLRMVKEFKGIIYALPYSNDAPSQSMADIIKRTAGVPPHQVRHVDLQSQ